MGFVRKESYEEDRKRPKIAQVYLENMKTYFEKLYPSIGSEVIDSFLKEKIKQSFQSPNLDIIYHRSEGNAEIIQIPATKYVKEIVSNNNQSPSGTTYCLASQKESFIRISLEDKIKARNKFKKIYLTAKSEGRKVEADFYHKQQANAKIFNNGVAGGMKIKQFILGDKAGFASITSVGRLCVKQGYSIVERAVAGNIYLPAPDDAVSYIINHINTMPENFESVLIESGIYKPTETDLLNYITKNVKNYRIDPEVQFLSRLIDSLNPVERAYVFYVGCLKNLFQFNDEMMKSWIDSCFAPAVIDPSLYKDIDLNDIKKFENDIVMCMTSTNARRLGDNPKKPGQFYSIEEAREKNPDGLKEFIYCCQHFVDNFSLKTELLKSILQINTTFGKLTFQNKMSRYSVSISDTDSNIFSTQELVKWKTGSYNFEQKSYEMHALLIFIITQTLEHVFAKLSAGFGMEEKDIFRISMKNEFLFPVLIMTSMAKHYVAIATMQEGILLRHPLKEIKGVGLRSSAYPKLVKDRFEEFSTLFIDDIMKHTKIKAGSVLKYIAELEKEILNSLLRKESHFLQTVSVKNKEEYKNSDSSSYFYYELWKDVFEEDYGEMILPNKCFKIPLKGDKKFFKNEILINQLTEKYPEIMQRFKAFREKTNNRDISFILIPPFKGEIKSIFIDIMDMRRHISESMTAFYRFLNALGIGSVDRREDGLVSDFYDPSEYLIE